MNEINDLMDKMLLLIESIPEESIVESLMNNKVLIEEISAIAETFEIYKTSAAKRESLILDIMDKYGDRDDCLYHMWLHCLVKFDEAPTALLSAVVILTIPCLKHFINN